MKYDEIIEEVKDGAKFFINLERRTLRLKGKLIDLREVSSAMDVVSCHIRHPRLTRHSYHQLTDMRQSADTQQCHRRHKYTREHRLGKQY